jgi:HPt (histidine-containing phosphotransfer) domain-containing protein
MLFRLSRVSFWLAAAVAALALLAPGAHATLLTAIAAVASATAFGLWRSAARTRQRIGFTVSSVPGPVLLTSASLLDAAATLVRLADEAATFEAALHAVARVLRGELGARRVTVCELRDVDATHAQVIDLIESRPGFRAVARRVRLDGTPLGRALADRKDVVTLPAAIALPVVSAGSAVAVIEWNDIGVMVDPTALAGLLDLARLTLCRLAPGAETGQGQPAPVGGSAPSPPAAHVEDNVLQAEVAARLPGRWGCRVTRASGMLQSMGMLGRTQFDPVVADWQVGGGFAGATAGDVPVIAISGPGLPGDGQRLREAGFDDHLCKPFRQGQMLGLLNRHRRRQLPADSRESVATGGAGEAPVLDPAALARLVELDPKGENHLLERVLQAFQSSVARLRPQADAARLKGDLAGVRLVAHTLKSSSASIGAMRLSQLCAQIETTIRLETGDDLHGQLDALGVALDSVLQAIAELLKERG